MQQKRGQFYLFTTIILITIIAGFATISNYSERKTAVKIYQIGEELNIESENAIDYGVSNSQNLETLLTGFTQDYSEHSDVENLYFIFGDASSVKVAGCKKTEDGEIKVENSLGTNLLILTLTKGQCNPINSGTINSMPSDKKLILVENNIKYPFTLQAGENFYFVISKEIDGERHIYSNG